MFNNFISYCFYIIKDILHVLSSCLFLFRLIIFCLNKERKGYCSREGFSSFLLKYCVHFLEPQFCSKINWTATYTWILDLAKTVLSYCWNKVNEISCIFFSPRTLRPHFYGFRWQWYLKSVKVFSTWRILLLFLLLASSRTA